MVKKATVKKSDSRSFASKYGAALLITLLILAIGGAYGYNKYLDRQNVSDMKQLLADFEKLKTDVETETGEELFIEASCGGVGKFPTSYACTLYLRPAGDQFNKTIEYSLLKNTPASLEKEKCMLASEGYAIKNEAENYFLCSGFHIRGSNTETAERIFYNYDTSPGYAI